MRVLRSIALLLIAAAGIGLVALLYQRAITPPLESSLAPLYQILGRPTKALSSALTRVMPIGDVDEKEYGDAIVERFGMSHDAGSADHRYVNSIMRGISAFKRKRFEYRAFIMSHPAPNAFALPGGVVFVTSGLLELLRTESELAAILAHEMGHIELNHCMDIVRFELAARKIQAESLGKLADFAMAVMLRHSYSKTQENEADDYSFALLKNTSYDPYGTGSAFMRLAEANGSTQKNLRQKRAHVMRDYFSSHPPIELRANKYAAQAAAWWRAHPGSRRYVGTANLAKRASFFERSIIASEWVLDSRHIPQAMTD